VVGHPTLSEGVDREYFAQLAPKMDPRTNIWHSDITFVADCPAFTLLRAVEIPPQGGETLWSNTVAAYESLPPVLRELADRLWVVHTNGYDPEVRVVDPEREEADRRFRVDIFARDEFETHHPLVRVHPETGERSLVLGAFGRRGFVGVDGADSASLFELFQRHVTSIENTVRWRWTPGDLAIWDNRATQHYASHDYGDLPRRMDRTTVAGEMPVSVDGRESVVVLGADHPWYSEGGSSSTSTSRSRGRAAAPIPSSGRCAPASSPSSASRSRPDARSPPGTGVFRGLHDPWE
jgi:taurine dioxygenase